MVNLIIMYKLVETKVISIETLIFVFVQFVDVCGKPLICYTIEALHRSVPPSHFLTVLELMYDILYWSKPMRVCRAIIIDLCVLW